MKSAVFQGMTCVFRINVSEERIASLYPDGEDEIFLRNVVVTRDTQPHIPDDDTVKYTN
jgi:hypothetical protein